MSDDKKELAIVLNQPIRTDIFTLNNNEMAQIFSLTEPTVVHSVDLWFTDKCTTDHVVVHIRPISKSGKPASSVFAEGCVKPEDITVGSPNPTRVSLRWPLHLESNVRYALVVRCHGNGARLNIAKIGQFDQEIQHWFVSWPEELGPLLTRPIATPAFLTRSALDGWKIEKIATGLSFRLIGQIEEENPCSTTTDAEQILKEFVQLMTDYGDWPDTTAELIHLSEVADKARAYFEKQKLTSDAHIDNLLQPFVTIGHRAGCEKNAFGEQCTCGFDEDIAKLKAAWKCELTRALVLKGD